MKKFILPLLMILSAFWLLGCTAGTTEVQAADPVIVERPTQAAINDLSANTPQKFCPVTHPLEEPFVPPVPFRQDPYPGQFFYGTEALWTALPLDQSWYALPYNNETGYGQKLFFQRVGYDWQEEPEPALIVSGRRIDPEGSEDMTLITHRATNGYTPEDGSFMLVGAEFPTTGCWEITARYGRDALSFTIWIAP